MPDKCNGCGNTSIEKQLLSNLKRQLDDPPKEYQNTGSDYRGHRVVTCPVCNTPLKLVREIDLKLMINPRMEFYKDHRRIEKQTLKAQIKAEARRTGMIRPIPGDGSSYFDMSDKSWVYRAGHIIALVRQPFRVFTPEEIDSVAIELNPEDGKLVSTVVKER